MQKSSEFPRMLIRMEQVGPKPADNLLNSHLRRPVNATRLFCSQGLQPISCMFNMREYRLAGAEPADAAPTQIRNMV
jgi:hypothetical protein